MCVLMVEFTIRKIYKIPADTCSTPLKTDSRFFVERASNKLECFCQLTVKVWSNTLDLGTTIGSVPVVITRVR
jgi:hypothetical protein